MVALTASFAALPLLACLLPLNPEHSSSLTTCRVPSAMTYLYLAALLLSGLELVQAGDLSLNRISATAFVREMVSQLATSHDGFP